MCPLTGAVVPPSEATIRRVASGVDAQALEAVIAGWVAGQLSPVETDAGRVAVAVDGKTVRGARVAGDGPAPHLLSAATRDRSLVLAQRRSQKDQRDPHGRRASGRFARRWARTGGDGPYLGALHTQHATADSLDKAGAGYVLTVNGNQPRLRAAIIDRLGDHRQPARTRQLSRGHART